MVRDCFRSNSPPCCRMRTFRLTLGGKTTKGFIILMKSWPSVSIIKGDSRRFQLISMHSEFCFAPPSPFAFATILQPGFALLNRLSDCRPTHNKRRECHANGRRRRRKTHSKYTHSKFPTRYENTSSCSQTNEGR